MKRVLVGLVGNGIAASLSPALHEEEGARLGLRYFYQLIDLSGVAGDNPLANAIASAESIGFAGCNVTHPFKQSAMALIDEASDEAAVLGAINTILFVDGRRVGHNTDWWGFSEALSKGLPGASMESVAVLGAGGAGSAVCYALLRLGAVSLKIFDTERSRTLQLVERLSRHFPSATLDISRDVSLLVEGADGLVQATPIGMTGHDGQPVPTDSLNPGLWVADVVYTPLTTRLIAEASGIGCRTLTGGRMAVYQAARSFELFTGQPSNVQRMQSHFDRLQS